MMALCDSDHAVQRHVSIGCFVMDLDRRVVSTCATTPSQVRNNIGSRKSATPAATLDSAQEVFDLCIEGERLFQVDGMAGIGADPQARVGKRRFEHQVGIEAANVFIADSEQYRNGHF
jgi:hypothetical protein